MKKSTKAALAIGSAAILVILGVSPATATGESLVPSHGNSYNYMKVTGGGLYVSKVSMNHAHVTENVCQWHAKWTGIKSTGAAWSATSAYHAGCAAFGFVDSAYPAINFKNGSEIRGYAWDNGLLTGGQPTVAIWN